MHLLLVNSTDVALWANTRDAQDRLPQVLRRLALATVDRLSHISFRTAEGVQIGGWDGIIHAQVGNAFVPAGVSAWEAGADRDIKGKADDDYDKRSSDPLGLVPADTSFVFVTPRRWKNKQSWAATKRKERKWKDVLVFDADDLATWLEQAPAVHIWLSAQLGKHPNGAEDLLSFWLNWSRVTQPPTSAELVTAGRQQPLEEVHSWMRGQPGAFAVQGETADEAIAFFAASLYSLQDEERDRTFARTIIVKDPNAWRILSASQQPLILIPVLADRSIVTAAVTNGHHLLVPLGRSESPLGRVAELARPRRPDAMKALINMGLPTERSTDLAKMARSSLGAMRRALALHPAVLVPKWAAPDSARDLLPALLAGRWDEKSAADKAILSSLAGKSYSDYRELLIRLADEPDPPVRQIDTTWIVVAKDDAWALLARYLTTGELERFEAAVLEVVGELNPKFELPPEEHWHAALLGKLPKHSSALAGGLADTLALMAATSEAIPLRTTLNGQGWASRIVHYVFDGTTAWQSWASFGGQLRSLAEAAPDVFLTAVERGLSGEKPLLFDLFVDADPMLAHSPHTELLWALELLAWSPEYLSRTSLLLARLVSLDPGGRTANRPLRSLHEIFLFWHPSTSANIEQRLKVLNLIRKREPQVGWQLVASLLPQSAGGVAFSTAKPRHREWVLDDEQKITNIEYFKGLSTVTGWLAEGVGTSGSRWETLIDALGEVSEVDFGVIVRQLSAIDLAAIENTDRMLIWNSLRAFISRHREFASAQWALPAEKINELEKVYERIGPTDPIERNTWIFGNNPSLLQGIREWRDQRRVIAQMQTEAVDGVLAAAGIDGVWSFATRVDRPGDVGEALGKSSLPSEQDFYVLGRTLGAADTISRNVGIGFLTGRAELQGDEWLQRIPSSDTWKHWTPAQRADYFLARPFGSATWDILAREEAEVQRLYWTQVSIYGRGSVPDVERDRAARTLAAFGYLATAAELLSLYSKGERVPPDTELAIQILEGIATGKNLQEKVPWPTRAHAISELMRLVENSALIDGARLFRLEWFFLPLVKHYRHPRLLQQALASEPEFFVTILSLIYKARSEEVVEVSEENRVRALMGYELLRDWKLAPGLGHDGTVDVAKLTAWVASARKLAAAAGRAEVADLHIGEVLIHYPPGADGAWPHEAVRELLEEVGSESIERGIYTGIINSRGVVTRDIGAGGEQERLIAERHQKYAAVLADEWPRTSHLMKIIAVHYESDGRRMDIQGELDEELMF